MLTRRPELVDLARENCGKALALNELCPRRTSPLGSSRGERESPRRRSPTSSARSIATRGAPTPSASWAGRKWSSAGPTGAKRPSTALSRCGPPTGRPTTTSAVPPPPGAIRRGREGVPPRHCPQPRDPARLLEPWRRLLPTGEARRGREDVPSLGRDPPDAGGLSNLGTTLFYLRRYGEAAEALPEGGGARRAQRQRVAQPGAGPLHEPRAPGGSAGASRAGARAPRGAAAGEPPRRGGSHRPRRRPRHGRTNGGGTKAGRSGDRARSRDGDVLAVAASIYELAGDRRAPSGRSGRRFEPATTDGRSSGTRRSRSCAPIPATQRRWPRCRRVPGPAGGGEFVPAMAHLHLLPGCYQPRPNQAQQRRYFLPSFLPVSPSFVVLGPSWWWSAPSPVRATNL